MIIFICVVTVPCTRFSMVNSTRMPRRYYLGRVCSLTLQLFVRQIQLVVVFELSMSPCVSDLNHMCAYQSRKKHIHSTFKKRQGKLGATQPFLLIVLYAVRWWSFPSQCKNSKYYTSCALYCTVLINVGMYTLNAIKMAPTRNEGSDHEQINGTCSIV